MCSNREYEIPDCGSSAVGGGHLGLSTDFDCTLEACKLEDKGAGLEDFSY